MVGAATAAIVQAAGPVEVLGIGAISGDTILIEFEGEAREIMIDGIDAPEAEQPYGLESKELLSTLVAGKNLTIEIVAQTTAGELIGRADVDGLDVAHEILAAGAAWHDTANNEDEELLLTFMKARSARKGLWANPSPVSPQIWRENHKRPPTPVPRPKSLADLAEDLRRHKDKSGTTNVASGGADMSEFLLEAKEEVAVAAATCLQQQGNLKQFSGPYVETGYRNGTEGTWEMIFYVPDPEARDGKRGVPYKWVGQWGENGITLKCADLRPR